MLLISAIPIYLSVPLSGQSTIRSTLLALPVRLCFFGSGQTQCCCCRAAARSVLARTLLKTCQVMVVASAKVRKPTEAIQRRKNLCTWGCKALAGATTRGHTLFSR